jgi:hypothetical protein
MRIRFAIALTVAGLPGCAAPEEVAVAPPELVGSWEDDYGIRFNISETLWLQRPSAVYRVTRWDASARFLVARNGPDNPTDAGLYTRIDWVRLEGGDPWEWAFCLATWDANSAEGAALAPATDRDQPRTGCGGYPFSRMRRVPADSAPLPGAGYP